MVSQFDLSDVEAKYSSLGRHGHHPRSVLAVWLYASQMGIFGGRIGGDAATRSWIPECSCIGGIPDERKQSSNPFIIVRVTGESFEQLLEAMLDAGLDAASQKQRFGHLSTACGM